MFDFSAFEFHWHNSLSAGVSVLQIMTDEREGALFHIARRYDGRWSFDILWLSMLKTDA